MDTDPTYLNYIFSFEQASPFDREELPSDKVIIRIRVTDPNAVGDIRKELDKKSASSPEQYLTDLRVYGDRDDNNVIVIKGYPPRHNYDVQPVLDVVLQLDPAAVVV